MELNREEVIKKINDFRRQENEHFALANQASGAAQALEAVLAHIDTVQAEPVVTELTEADLAKAGLTVEGVDEHAQG